VDGYATRSTLSIRPTSYNARLIHIFHYRIDDLFHSRFARVSRTSHHSIITLFHSRIPIPLYHSPPTSRYYTRATDSSTRLPLCHRTSVGVLPLVTSRSSQCPAPRAQVYTYTYILSILFVRVRVRFGSLFLMEFSFSRLILGGDLCRAIILADSCSLALFKLRRRRRRRTYYVVASLRTHTPHSPIWFS